MTRRETRPRDDTEGDKAEGWHGRRQKCQGMTRRKTRPRDDTEEDKAEG